MRMSIILIFVSTFVISFIQMESAFSQNCPLRIAAVENDSLTRESVPIFRQIYNELGCSLEITFLPGRRGIQNFNLSLVDGELMRIELIEEKYEKAFVRSTSPVMHITNAIWEHPSQVIVESRPTGYILGIAWQEKYVSETPNTRFIIFYNDNEVLNAYNRGAIGSFLLAKQSLNIFQDPVKLNPPPILKKIVSKLPLYHYLDIKYVKFMTAFSEKIRVRRPFSKLE